MTVNECRSFTGKLFTQRKVCRLAPSIQQACVCVSVCFRNSNKQTHLTMTTFRWHERPLSSIPSQEVCRVKGPNESKAAILNLSNSFSFRNSASLWLLNKTFPLLLLQNLTSFLCFQVLSSTRVSRPDTGKELGFGCKEWVVWLWCDGDRHRNPSRSTNRI